MTNNIPFLNFGVQHFFLDMSCQSTWRKLIALRPCFFLWLHSFKRNLLVVTRFASLKLNLDKFV